MASLKTNGKPDKKNLGGDFLIKKRGGMHAIERTSVCLPYKSVSCILLLGRAKLNFSVLIVHREQVKKKRSEG